MTNIPYIKTFDQNGNVSNPIIGSLLNNFPNRRTRRQNKSKQRFHGESNNLHLSVNKYSKYLRIRQMEFDKEGNKKIIEHYILSK